MDQAQIQKTLMEELGLADLPQDKQEQLLVKMTEVLLKRIFVETMDKLNDQAKDEYEKLVDQESTPEQVETFLKTNIPDYESLVQKIIGDFKVEMKGNL
jgi:hypothetical protein